MKKYAITLLSIIAILSMIAIWGGGDNDTRKCKYPGCSYTCAPDSDYCYVHSPYKATGQNRASSSYSSSSYSSPSNSSKSYTGLGGHINAGSIRHGYNRETHSYEDSDNSSAGSTVKEAAPKATTRNSSTTKKTYENKNWDAYDQGYEDVDLDGDFDWDRYWEDDEYATGVDDAMEDNEDDW